MTSWGRSFHPRVSVFVLYFLIALPASAQTSDPHNPRNPIPEVPFTLHITTREVLVDVIAVNSHNQPVVDLTPADLQVVEKDERSSGSPGSIASFRLIDPTQAKSTSLPRDGFHIAANESCLQRHSLHYELAYRPGPEGLTAGYHHVQIRSLRRGVHLFYRHDYYIGATAAPEGAVPNSAQDIDHQLQIDACSHPLAPLSISLRAFRISTGAENLVRYSVSIDSGSLDFVSYSDNGRRLQLDYGACNFNAAGKPIDYMRASTDQILTPVDFARAQAHGFNRIFEFTPPKDLAMTRFVVRDRLTGNLGLVDVTFPLKERPPQDDPAVMEQFREQTQLAKQIEAEVERARAAGYSASASMVPQPKPPMGPLGSFGGVVPRPGAFCGDVYELHPGMLRLPDFRDLDPIGSIYTYSLAVPDQIFLGTNGIPGVTDRTIWFGVDYHATFWVRQAGKYDFRMTSDDGAILQIDDKRVIDLDELHSALTREDSIKLDAGRHTMHVPYYEGTPDAVALSLWVRGPGEKDWKLFDLRDFAAPQDHSAGTQR